MDLIEKPAELEHVQWQQWAEKIMETEDISPARKERWKSLCVPYSQLPEEWKEYDRQWARKVVRTVALHLDWVAD